MSHPVTAHGADGDGLDTMAFQAALDTCADERGGTVTVPPGEYEVGALELHSHVTLHLEAGATLYPSHDPADYGLRTRNTDDVREEVFLLADDVVNVAIVGQGTIDGRAADLYDAEEVLTSHHGDRGGLVAEAPPDPRQSDFLDRDGDTSDWPLAKPGFRMLPVLAFVDARNVRLRDVTLEDMPGHTILLRRCRDVVTSGLSIDNGMRTPNADGIAINNSQDVHISDCTIRGADDSITPSASANGPPTRNVTVTNCTFQTHACAVKIGSGTTGEIRDLVVSNCNIESSTRGVGIQHRDGGTVENIVFSNLTVETYLRDGPWWGKAEPVYITSIPRRKETRAGSVRNVRVSNVVSDAEGPVFVYASHGGTVENVILDGLNLSVSGGKGSAAVGGNFDLQPTGVRAPIYEHDVPAVYCRGIRNLSVSDVTVSWGTDRPEYLSHAIECTECTDVCLDGVVGGPAHDGEPAISLADIDGVIVRDSQARPGTGAFVAIDGGTLRRFDDNDCADALRPLARDSGPEVTD